MTLPLEQALALRTVIGGVSPVCMFGLSFAGRQLFFFCRWPGLLPVVEMEEPAPIATAA